MPNEVDYKANKNGTGGSPKGRDNRKCPRPMKKYAKEWAVETIAGGNESYFIHNPNASGRFTPRRFEPLIPLLYDVFPEEAETYFGGREDRAAKLIMHRVHKMYYWNDGVHKGRGKSNEHPENW